MSGPEFLTPRERQHWSSGRCWCDEFHRDQVETIALTERPSGVLAHLDDPWAVQGFPVRLTRAGGGGMITGPSEQVTESGVYTAPDGRVYVIEIRDVVLACDLDHEHEMACYEPAPEVTA